MPVVSRGPVRALLVAVLAAAFALVAIAPAQAAAYRFWGYYSLTDGAWGFAQKGSDQTVPADGSVEGWRFAVAGEDSTRLPRAILTFDQICGTTPAQDGRKRIGVVVDFGRDVDAETPGATVPAPEARCAVVPTGATGTDVLEQVGAVRVENGLICAVGGYPATGCGGEVKDLTEAQNAPDAAVTIAAPTPNASPTPVTAPADTASDSGSSSTLAYTVAALVLIALLASVLLRSRRAAAAREQAADRAPTTGGRSHDDQGPRA